MSGIISRVNNDIIETYQGQDAQGDVGDSSVLSALASKATVKRSMGISILEYQIYATQSGGVVTDWQPAIAKALSDLSLSVVSNKTLLFPAGTYPIINLIALTSQHNGITICGEGYFSEIKLVNGWTQGWMFWLNDSTTPLNGITIKNLRLNGNKANTGNSGTTGFGIYIQQPSGLDNTNLFIESVWAHDFQTTGFNLFTSNVILNNVFSYNHGLHGIGTDVGKNVIIDNANCYNNAGYGIDFHGGQGIVNNVLCGGNTLGGMKTSNGATIYLTLTNAKLNNNGGQGFTTTNSNGSTYFFDNIEVVGNTSVGFRLTEGVFASIGKIFASGNNTSNSAGSGQVMIDIPATVDSVVVQGGNGYGLMFDNGTKKDINHVNIQNCTNYGVYAYAADISINSGRILNNCTASGNIGIYLTASGILKAKNIEIGDTNATKKQARGIYVDAGCTALIYTCDLRNCSPGNNFIVDNGAAAIIARNNLGYVNEKTGLQTASGTGVATVFTIAHGLNTTPNYVNVIPANPASMGNYSITVDATNITITYTTAPTSGTSNISWYWEAKYNK